MEASSGKRTKLLPANAYTKLGPGEVYKPIVPASDGRAEVTRWSVILGILMVRNVLAIDFKDGVLNFRQCFVPGRWCRTVLHQHLHLDEVAGDFRKQHGPHKTAVHQAERSGDP